MTRELLRSSVEKVMMSVGFVSFANMAKRVQRLEKLETFPKISSKLQLRV